MFIDKRLKLIVIFVVVLGAATLLVFTFGEKKRGNEAVSTLVENESYLKGSLKASTETAVVVDNVQVYLDEVTYYAMTTQATYETYYIANNMTLDWNSKVEDGVTLEMAVKSKLLDDICRRESLIYQATHSELDRELNAALSESEKDEVEEKTEIFFRDTSAKLIERIGISQERLKEVFTKEALYNKLLNEAEDAGLNTDEIYENWKKSKSVATLDDWDNLKFTDTIFSKDDLKEE